MQKQKRVKQFGFGASLFVLLLAFMGCQTHECIIPAPIEDTSTASEKVVITETFFKDMGVNRSTPNGNTKDSTFLRISAWCNDKIRVYIKPDLSLVPPKAIIDSAHLTMHYTGYSVPNNGKNGFYVERVIEDWSETTLSWNNQASSTEEGRVYVPHHFSEKYDLIDLDVSGLVSELFSGKNYGLLLRLEKEVPYNNVVFGSSEHGNPSKRPSLTVYYHY